MEKELTYTPKPEDFVIEGCDDAAAEQMPGGVSNLLATFL